LGGAEWYRKVLKWIGKPDRETWELWTSDYQGNDWRQVGFLEHPDSEPMPYALKWTPDGKRISFLVAKTLYVVDAD
jgi:hypothetical protein